MPIHDWTRVSAGSFHHFHQDWTIELCRSLNRGLLPPGYEAVAEGKVLGYEPDVLTYARRANRVVVRHEAGAVVAVVEVVSPGNKHSAAAVEDFRDKAVEFLRRGVNLVVIDLFPPTRRDPGGLARVIWDHVAPDPLPAPPGGKPLAVAAVAAADGPTVYLDPLAVGDELPEAALFLAPGWYVRLPLEATYMRSWAELTPRVRAQLDPPPTV